MKSFEIYKQRNGRRLMLEADFCGISEIAAQKSAEAEALRKSLDFACSTERELKYALLGDREVETRTAIKQLRIDDRVCGEMPCLSVRFKRSGFVGDSHLNCSSYQCQLVLPRYAVFTRMQSRVIFDTIREVLDFETAPGGAGAGQDRGEGEVADGK